MLHFFVQKDHLTRRGRCAILPFVTHKESRARKQPLSRLECYLHNTGVNILFKYIRLEHAAKLANKPGVKHTVIMVDQTLHDISNELREQASPDDDEIGMLLSCVCCISLETLWAQLKNYVEQ